MHSNSRRGFLRCFGGFALGGLAFGRDIPDDDTIILKRTFADLLFGTKAARVCAGPFADFSSQDLVGIHHDADGNLAGPFKSFRGVMDARKWGMENHDLGSFAVQLDSYIDLTNRYHLGEELAKLVEHSPTLARWLAACHLTPKDVVPTVEKVGNSIGLTLFLEDEAVDIVERYRGLDIAKDVKKFLPICPDGFVNHGLERREAGGVTEFMEFQPRRDAKGIRFWSADYVLQES